jgi:transposase
MLSFPPAVRIWLATAPADLRKSFDTLAELVRQHLQQDPLSGHVFVFRHKRSDRVKLLDWDEDGFVLVYKRLEAGTFHFPAAGAGAAGVTLRAAELAMLLDGVAWQHARRAKRYQRPAPPPV